MSEAMRHILRPTAGIARTGRAIARAVCTLRARPIAQDKRGSALIEFAAVAAPFIALIFANLATSVAFFSQQLLDTTTEKMSRRLMTGQVQKAGTSQEDFKLAICNDLPSYLSCDRVMVNVSKAADFGSADTSAAAITFNAKGEVTNKWKFEAGKPGEVVLMQVYYRWPNITGPLGFSLANMSNGERLLVSTAIFKTEQYE
jgi:Flp pilus assembly protein TadG